MNLVIVHHLNNPQPYLFNLPEDKTLHCGDIVMVQTNRGENIAVCVSDSFVVTESVANTLMTHYGGKTLRPVIGILQYTKWDVTPEPTESPA